jgi:hypothetical protein
MNVPHIHWTWHPHLLFEINKENIPPPLNENGAINNYYYRDIPTSLYRNHRIVLAERTEDNLHQSPSEDSFDSVPPLESDTSDDDSIPPLLHDEPFDHNQSDSSNDLSAFLRNWETWTVPYTPGDIEQID